MKPTVGIIYCIHCISTGEKYIGQTRRQLTERIRDHYYDSKKNHIRSKLYKQSQKTGWEDFIYGIIIECEVENLDNFVDKLLIFKETSLISSSSQKYKIVNILLG
jgi:group I intron endonuclease